jgi:hypothetical protein
VRRRFTAAVLRRDQAATRVDVSRAERKAQRWSKAEHLPQWYRQQIARKQRELTVAQTDLELLGAQHDEMMERLEQAHMRHAGERIGAIKASLNAPPVDTARRSPAS